MGREARPGAYSKVRPFARLCVVVAVANGILSTSRWKITGLPLVPSMVYQLVNSPEWEKTDCSTIETTASGAAFLPPKLRAKFQSKMNSTLFEGYGSSESVRIPLVASMTLERFTRWSIRVDPLDHNNDARECYPWIQAGR